MFAEQIVETSGKSFVGKLVEAKPSSIHAPGPGSYKNVVKPLKNNFKFSMGGKLEDIASKKANFAPGPGNYDPTILARSAPRTKFGSSQRTVENERETK